MIPFLDLKQINKRFEKDLCSEFSDFLESGEYMLGSAVSNFEKDFSTYCGTKYAIGVSNGLDALTLIFKSFIELSDLKLGDEVLVPSNTYIASVLAIVNAGLVPVFVEPELKTFNIAPLAIKSKINLKTKAILVVHLYGQLCNMDAINSIAKLNNLLVVEDSAQSHGATTNEGFRSGNLSDASGFSFYPTKNLGALGDGGAIVTNNSALAKVVTELRNYGTTSKYVNNRIGYNNRLDAIQARFLSLKLKGLDADNLKRQKIAKAYLKGVSNSKITLPNYNNTANHVFHLFVVLVKERNNFISYLEQSGVQSAVHYPIPPHKQKALKMYNNLKFPISEYIHNTCVSIPISPILTDSQVKTIIKVLNNY